MTTVEAINTKAEYKTVLKKLDELITGDPKKEAPAYNELDMIGTLASAYEDIHYPIEYLSILKQSSN